MGARGGGRRRAGPAAVSPRRSEAACRAVAGRRHAARARARTRPTARRCRGRGRGEPGPSCSRARTAPGRRTAFGRGRRRRRGRLGPRRARRRDAADLATRSASSCSPDQLRNRTRSRPHPRPLQEEPRRAHLRSRSSLRARTPPTAPLRDRGPARRRRGDRRARRARDRPRRPRRRVACAAFEGRRHAATHLIGASGRAVELVEQGRRPEAGSATELDASTASRCSETGRPRHSVQGIRARSDARARRAAPPA